MIMIFLRLEIVGLLLPILAYSVWFLGVTAPSSAAGVS